RPPHCGHSRTSRSNTRLIRSAHFQSRGFSRRGCSLASCGAVAGAAAGTSVAGGDGPRAPHLEGGMERRHHAPLVRTDRVARTAGGAHAAPAHQPRSVPWSVAPHSRWRARAVAYGRDTLAPVGRHAAVACASATPPVPSSARPFDGGLEASGAAHRDPVVTLGGHQSEP